MTKRTFIETPLFSKKWKELGLSDQILRNLQNEIINDPKAGVCYTRYRRS